MILEREQTVLRALNIAVSAVGNMEEMIEQRLSVVSEFSKEPSASSSLDGECRRMRLFLPTPGSWSKTLPDGWVIRETTEEDIDAVALVQARAFGSDLEARLTEELLGDVTAEPKFSLAVFRHGEAVGHILWTHVRFAHEGHQPLMQILAPLAVVPECRRMGMGGLLVCEGLCLLEEKGSRLAFVLGHTEYYRRFGFIPSAGQGGFAAPYTIADEDCWMVRAIGAGGLDAMRGGRIVCCDALNRPELWQGDEAGT